MKKIFFAIICTVLAFTVIGISVYADEITEVPSEEGVLTEENTTAIEESTFKQWLDEWQSAYEAEQAEAEEPSTFAEWILKKVMDKLAEILAAFAAVFASINMIYSRKKIKQPLDNFTKTTSKNLTKFTNDISGLVETANKNAAAALKVTEEYSKAYEDLKKSQAQLFANQKQLDEDRKALTAAMKVQSEMLNTVIQSSTLTQWKKDQIGQLYANATEHIAKLEKKSGGDIL